MKLGQIVEINKESINSRFDSNEEIEYIDITSIDTPGSQAKTKKILFGSAPSRAKRIVSSGDVLVSTVRPYLAAFTLVQKAPHNLIASTGFAVLSPTKIIDSGYLIQMVLSEDFIRFLCTRMIGSNYPAVTADDIASYVMYFPPLQKQRRIAKILNTVDQTITQTEQLIQKLSHIKDGLLHDLLTKGINKDGQIRDPVKHPEMFIESELGLIPRDWNVLYLDELLTLCQYGVSEKISEHGKFPILKMDNIESGKIVFDEIGFTDIPEKMYRNYELSEGDILFNRTNSKEWVGKVGIFRGTSGYTFASYLIRLQCDPGFIDSFYLNHYLNFKPVVTKIKRLATPGVSQWNVNATNLKTLKIKVPHLNEQKHIVNIIESVEDRIELEKEQIEKLRKIQLGLMHDLLTGSVRTKKETS